MSAYFNEMFDRDAVRAPYAQLQGWVDQMPAELRNLKQAEAEALFRRIGITFAVYGEGGDPDRLIPFDMMPRVFEQAEWRKLERGIKQRARALNAFLPRTPVQARLPRGRRAPPAGCSTRASCWAMASGKACGLSRASCCRSTPTWTGFSKGRPQSALISA